jgi:hypothetical protein
LSGCKRWSVYAGFPIAIPSLPDDFKELLKSLDSNGVDYLLVGGYAVNIHGYVRTTNDLDIG